MDGLALDPEVGRKEAREVGREAVIDLEIDEVVENRGQDGFRIGSFEKAEDVLHGMELPGLVGHRPVDDDGDPLELPALAGHAQPAGSVHEDIDEPVEHALSHTCIPSKEV